MSWHQSRSPMHKLKEEGRKHSFIQSLKKISPSSALLGGAPRRSEGNEMKGIDTKIILQLSSLPVLPFPSLLSFFSHSRFS
mmetsp:Transcript_21591/g.42926  ORF Transcript_21591/g.42926 Transcript_21591/m.42926 type:complete len:81 (+) Transcript_21591:662-904(+)